ncbi:GumC family protein [Geosporobacter ferrireducens]|nr:Wzz/FepE/Etk N-terminal domain-containing protein [Geosporobacter ferrireducens]
MNAEEISLRELIEILIKQKKLIILITVASILVAGIVSFFILDPVYESRMVLMASQFSDKLQSTQIQGEGVDSILNSLSRYPTMTLETYRQQITAPRVMRETIAELKLEEEYDIASLAKAITLETIKDTNLITVKMQHSDPEMAAKIVSKVGEKFVAFVSDKAKEHASSSSSHINTQLETELIKLEEASNELKEFLSQPRGVSELEQELAAKLTQITTYKTNLTDLQIKQQSLKASIQVAETEAKGSNRIILKNQSDGEDNLSIDKLQLMIEDSATLLKIELAAVTSDIANIKEQVNILQKQIEELQVELQEKKHEARIIEKKVEIAQNTYDAFVKKYEELRVAESSQIGESTITVISKAYPATKPVGPRKAMNLAIATVLGVMIGVFAAFFIEYWKTSGNEAKRYQGENL